MVINMKYILKEMNEENKPREKLLKYGSNNLDDYELLAIILRTGTKDKSVIDMSIELLKMLPSINELQNITLEELLQIKGIGKTKAITLLACIEFGKRVTNYNYQKYYIKSSKDAYFYIKDSLSHLPQENFVAIYLAINNEVITKKTISIGTLNQTIASPKDIIRNAIKYCAYGVIIAHNHPSGDSRPSKEDLNFTYFLNESCEALDIKFVDHIIVGKNNYYSFKEKSIINIKNS